MQKAQCQNPILKLRCSPQKWLLQKLGILKLRLKPIFPRHTVLKPFLRPFRGMPPVSKAQRTPRQVNQCQKYLQQVYL